MLKLLFAQRLPFIRWPLFVLIVLMIAGCAAAGKTAPAASPTSTMIQSLTYQTMSVPPTAPLAVRTGQHPYSSTVQVDIGNGTTQTDTINYLLYLPVDYGKDPRQKWPLILFLHGSGERGNDLELLKTQPLPEVLERKVDFPFVVVSQQLPPGYEQDYTYVDYAALAWAWSSKIEALKVLLDQIQSTYAVDDRRVYLTGISMGGFGTWQFALLYPRYFAAIVPIAGGYIYQSEAVPENICDLKGLPVWVFHGAQDTNVSPAQDEVLVNALKACGGTVRFTLYPGIGHDAWLAAYADPELYQWLLAQTRK
jgi:predicted peptidase